MADASMIKVTAILEVGGKELRTDIEVEDEPSKLRFIELWFDHAKASLLAKLREMQGEADPSLRMVDCEVCSLRQPLPVNEPDAMQTCSRCECLLFPEQAPELPPISAETVALFEQALGLLKKG